jgi:RNA-directed DNA polymerase
VKSEDSEDNRARVPARAKRGGETPGHWSWVEPSVWTERMLAALDKGVEGGRWYSLMDKVCSRANLEASWRQVRRNRGSAGVDHVSIAKYEASLESNLESLARDLREGNYRPQKIRRVFIDKAGSPEKRPLGIPTVRDRVVQGALRQVLEPIFERDFAAQSYGFRPGRSAKDALRRVWELLESGSTWVVDVDFRRYYDTIPHDPLLSRVQDKVSDGRVLSLVEGFLKQEVMECTADWHPGEGTPQGAVLSPLLSNIYLDGLDQKMAGLGFEMVRYADDLVVLCRSAEEAERAMSEVESWSATAGLQIHPEKTCIVDATQPGGFDFLGYHFERGWRWPSRKSLQKHKDKIRELTPRTNGVSLRVILENVNRVRRGWFEYFKHSCKPTFAPLDKWTRMRLRSILRKRQGRRGKGRGRDHHRWPNAFFAELGLFSYVPALALIRRSSRR